MPDEIDIKMCATATNHAQLGNTGSCTCGLKRYVVKTERPKVLDCAFCGNLPEPEPTMNQQSIFTHVFCATEGCPAFSNVVQIDRWNQRRCHEQEVAHIPKEEPIFVLRARDMFALKPLWVWIDLADKKAGPAGERVSEEKVQSAMTRANEMQAHQQAHGNKVPD